MHIEIHPAIVHFPIAFITLAYFFQLLSIIIPHKIPKHLNFWVLIPAVISTIPAVLSGQSAKNKLTNICIEAQNTLYKHELFANITTWGILLLSIIWIYLTLKGFSDSNTEKLFFAFLTLIFISVLITGYLGGQLVHLWKV